MGEVLHMLHQIVVKEGERTKRQWNGKHWEEVGASSSIR